MNARQPERSLRSLLGPVPVLVVLRRIDRSRAVRLAGILSEVGIDRLEVTFDAPDATATVEALRDAGTPVVAAGTVRTAAAVDQAVAAGVALILSPVLDRRVVERAHHHNVPVLPGVLTPTEAMQAVNWGCSAVKLFPASTVGTAHLTALHSVLDVEILPTGGIDAASAAAWREAGAIGIGVGGWLVGAKTDEDVRRRAAALARVVREPPETT